MTFGVVLFTLLGQGTTMQFLIKKLGLAERAEGRLEFERRHARLIAARAERDHIDRLHRDGSLSHSTWERLSAELELQIQTHLNAQTDLLAGHPALQAEELEDAKREGLRAQRAAIAALMCDGVISEQIYEELIAEIDQAGQDEIELPPDEPAD